MLDRGGEDGVDLLGGQAGAGRVVDRDEVARRVDRLQGPGDRVEPLGPPLDDRDVQERDVGPIPPLEQLAVLGRDRHDRPARRRRGPGTGRRRGARRPGRPARRRSSSASGRRTASNGRRPAGSPRTGPSSAPRSRKDARRSDARLSPRGRSESTRPGPTACRSPSANTMIRLSRIRAGISLADGPGTEHTGIARIARHGRAGRPVWMIA